MEFSRPEYWSGLPFPSPGDVPNPRIKTRSPTSESGAIIIKVVELRSRPELPGVVWHGLLSLFSKTFWQKNVLFGLKRNILHL